MGIAAAIGDLVATAMITDPDLAQDTAMSIAFLVRTKDPTGECWNRLADALEAVDGIILEGFDDE